MLPTPGPTLNISVLFEIVDAEIPALLGLKLPDRSNLFVGMVTNHLWNRLITNKDQLRFECVWKIKLIRKGDQLYVPLSIPMQLFHTMAQLRNLHEQFSHTTETKLHDLLKSAGNEDRNP